LPLFRIDWPVNGGGSRRCLGLLLTGQSVIEHTACETRDIEDSMNTKTPRNVLLVLTSREMHEKTGTPTGCWLEELAGAYWTFVDGDCQVALASIRGGRAPIDPMSQQAPWLGEAGQRFIADAAAMAEVAETRSLGSINSAEFDAIYLVGGAGADYDFPGDVDLARLVSELYRRGAPVAAVCHGVVGLLDAKDANGGVLVKGRRVTGISNAEEAAAQYDKILPVLPERALLERGAKYSAAAPFSEHVVQEGNLLTGQNPPSAAPLARAALTLLASPGVS
jgi:putative intracellular protease/amidase